MRLWELKNPRIKVKIDGNPIITKDRSFSWCDNTNVKNIFICKLFFVIVPICTQNVINTKIFVIKFLRINFFKNFFLFYFYSISSLFTGKKFILRLKEVKFNFKGIKNKISERRLDLSKFILWLPCDSVREITIKWKMD